MCRRKYVGGREVILKLVGVVCLTGRCVMRLLHMSARGLFQILVLLVVAGLVVLGSVMIISGAVEGVVTLLIVIAGALGIVGRLGLLRMVVGGMVEDRLPHPLLRRSRGVGRVAGALRRVEVLVGERAATAVRRVRFMAHRVSRSR